MAPFARALADAAAGRAAWVRFRRADGSCHEVPAAWFLEPFAHAQIERPLLTALVERLAAGAHVLDVGCGAGRHALWLQQRGFSVHAIDASPAVVQVARARGVEAEVASVWTLPGADRYQAAVLMGNSVGLAGTGERLPELLARLAVHAPLIALDSIDYGAGRGQIRVRVEYGRQAGAWFDWLHVARAELDQAAQAVGLRAQWVGPAADDSYGVLLSAAAGRNQTALAEPPR